MVFSSYLIGEEANEYVIEKYEQAHKVSSLTANSLFDRILVRLAAIHPIFTRLSDTYSRIFFRKSLVRQKLTLLVAILESSAPTYKYFDGNGTSDNRLLIMAKLVWVGILFVFTLFLAMIFLLPLQIFAQITGLLITTDTF